MKYRFLTTVILAITGGFCFAPGARAQAPAPSCTLPTTITNQTPAGYAEAAWKIFVAANCTSGNQLTWETWTEQNCFIGGPCGSGPQLQLTSHTSHLERFGTTRLRGANLGNANNCPNPPSYMTGAKVKPSNPCQPSPPDPSLTRYVPTNLASGAVFFEVVYVNPSESAFVKANVATLQKQAAYSKTKPIDFPKDAVEIKGDWIPAKSLQPSFTCSKPPADVYVQQIGSECYALAGIHISSKLLTDWLWATFEAPSTVTNPNRCNPALYSDCTDDWGVTPARVSRATAKTDPTKNLASLFTGAGGRLPALLRKYRLTGVQTAFVNGATPVLLGNSFTEFNANVPAKQASCMTCHNGAQVSTQGVASIAQFQGGFALKLVGTPQTFPPPSGGGSWKTEDFSWMLSLMPAK